MSWDGGNWAGRNCGEAHGKDGIRDGQKNTLTSSIAERARMETGSLPFW